jgi:hypothetical protein
MKMEMECEAFFVSGAALNRRYQSRGMCGEQRKAIHRDREPQKNKSEWIVARFYGLMCPRTIQMEIFHSVAQLNYGFEQKNYNAGAHHLIIALPRGTTSADIQERERERPKY